MIDTKKDRSTLFYRLFRYADVIQKLAPLFQKGVYHWSPDDGKVIRNIKALVWDTPWVYVKPHPFHRCDIAHHVIWPCFKFVPDCCRDCYKVVVRPRTLMELFDLYEIQKDLDVPCKCGIEVRDIVPGFYGGYFYNHGIDEGQERYEQVRERVSSEISPKTPVILKRYCSEFEVGTKIGEKPLGPSNKVPELTEHQKFIEQTIIELFENTMHATEYPEILTAFTMTKWIYFAHQNGDLTYLQCTDGKTIVPSVITYHKEK